MRTRADYQKITRMGKVAFRFYDPTCKLVGGDKYDSIEQFGADCPIARMGDCHVLETWPAEKVHAWYGACQVE